MQTWGYVGFGLSPNGNMYPADVVIGWVKDGKTFFAVSKLSCFYMQLTTDKFHILP